MPAASSAAFQALWNEYQLRLPNTYPLAFGAQRRGVVLTDRNDLQRPRESVANLQRFI